MAIGDNPQAISMSKDLNPGPAGSIPKGGPKPLGHSPQLMKRTILVHEQYVTSFNKNFKVI